MTSAAAARYARHYILAGIDRDGRAGVDLPPDVVRELRALAEQIVSDRLAVPSSEQRSRFLAAERNRRWRARKQGIDIPKRKPGPARRAS